MWVSVPKSWRALHPGEETSAELCGVSSPEAHPVLCPRWAPCCTGHLGVIPAHGCSTRGTRIPAFNCVVLGVGGGGTSWISDVCLTAPRDPPPSTLFASDAFFHFPRPPAPLGGPQPQLRGLLTGSHHPGPRGVLCRPRLGLSSQSQGSFPPGTLLFWPTLSPSANSNPRVGAHQGLEMGGQSSPQQKSPLAWKPRSALHPRAVHAFGWKAGAL